MPAAPQTLQGRFDSRSQTYFPLNWLCNGRMESWRHLLAASSTGERQALGVGSDLYQLANAGVTETGDNTNPVAAVVVQLTLSACLSAT